MTDDSAITLHAYLRPGTPSMAGVAAVAQIADLYESGQLGPGSRVWCNLDVPNALWVLSDISTFVRFVDVPTAGWVRLTKDSTAWARLADDTPGGAAIRYGVKDMPMPVQPHDTVTVAFVNTDPAPMRAQHTGRHHEMINREISHGMMRALDLKVTECREPPPPPSDWATGNAITRGLDLMACTSGPETHRVIRDNLDAYTTSIGAEELGRIKATRMRMSQIAEVITDPIAQRVAELARSSEAAAEE